VVNVAIDAQVGAVKLSGTTDDEGYAVLAPQTSVDVVSLLMGAGWRLQASVSSRGLSQVVDVIHDDDQEQVFDVEPPVFDAAPTGGATAPADTARAP
jgi:hypothetical protein